MKGFREGKGELRMKDGALFSSSWRQGVREGEGFEMHPDGYKFEGTYKNGLREGKGNLVSINGPFY